MRARYRFVIKSFNYLQDLRRGTHMKSAWTSWSTWLNMRWGQDIGLLSSPSTTYKTFEEEPIWNQPLQWRNSCWLPCVSTLVGHFFRWLEIPLDLKEYSIESCGVCHLVKWQRNQDKIDEVKAGFHEFAGFPRVDCIDCTLHICPVWSKI